MPTNQERAMEDNKIIIEQLQEKIEKLESEMDNIKSVLEIQDEDEFDYDSDEDDLEDLEDGDEVDEDEDEDEDKD